MHKCPISYEETPDRYSMAGLLKLSSRLKVLCDFPYGKSAQLELALGYSDKLSFSGVQPKLNTKLNLEKGLFEAVRAQGEFLFKLPHGMYEELPQNEDLTMRLASLAKIEVPLHGMLYAIDGSLIYFIKRFDRKKKQKIPVEDFGQLAGLPSDAKYDFSMEKLISIIDQFCTMPKPEKTKLLRLTLFNFLVGNEDMHLKNFSLIQDNGLVKLSPAYDLVNSTIVTKSKEELALPLRGKKSNLKREDFIDYYGKERLGLSDNLVSSILNDLQAALPSWKQLIERSFLSKDKKKAYLTLLEERTRRLFTIPL